MPPDDQPPQNKLDPSDASLKSSNDESNNNNDEAGNNNENSSPTGDVEKANSQPQSFIVDWDGPDDPEKPQNFSRKKKWLVTVLMATLTLTVAFSSAVFTTAAVVTGKEYHVSEEVTILATSLFILGLGIGPMFWGPLSELYGRKMPTLVSFAMFAIFQIPVAVARGVATILVFRFFQGFAGSAPIVVAGGAVADVWNPRERGSALPWYGGALFVGPTFAPIIGAFITDSYLGWRWTQWIVLIASAFFGVVALIFVPETFAPVVLAQRAKRLRMETGNWALHAIQEEKRLNIRTVIENYLMRPVRMLVREPILDLMTLYNAFIYGLLYLFLFAFQASYEGQRHFEGGVAGLPFLAILIGVLLACAVLSTTTHTKWAPNPAEGRPQETRLIIMGLGSVVLPIGLFWFAWTSNPHINVWPQIISGVPIGFGVMLISMQAMNYVLDCYQINAASALSGLTMVRSLFGAGFPLFAPDMFANLGVPWATSVLGFIAVALIAVPILFYIFGARIRSWSRFVPET